MQRDGFAADAAGNGFHIGQCGIAAAIAETDAIAAAAKVQTAIELAGQAHLVGARTTADGLDIGNRINTAGIAQGQLVFTTRQINTGLGAGITQLHAIGATAAGHDLDAIGGDKIFAIGQPQLIRTGAKVNRNAFSGNTFQHHHIGAGGTGYGFHIGNAEAAAGANLQHILACAKINQRAGIFAQRGNHIGAAAAEHGFHTRNIQPVAAIGQHQRIGAKQQIHLHAGDGAFQRHRVIQAAALQRLHIGNQHRVGAAVVERQAVAAGAKINPAARDKAITHFHCIGAAAAQHGFGLADIGQIGAIGELQHILPTAKRKTCAADGAVGDNIIGAIIADHRFNIGYAQAIDAISQFKRVIAEAQIDQATIHGAAQRDAIAAGAAGNCLGVGDGGVDVAGGGELQAVIAGAKIDLRRSDHIGNSYLIVAAASLQRIDVGQGVCTTRICQRCWHGANHSSCKTGCFASQPPNQKSQPTQNFCCGTHAHLRRNRAPFCRAPTPADAASRSRPAASETLKPTQRHAVHHSGVTGKLQ